MSLTYTNVFTVQRVATDAQALVRPVSITARLQLVVTYIHRITFIYVFITCCTGPTADAFALAINVITIFRV